MRRTHVAATALFAASQAFAQQADSQEYEAEGLVVSASRLPNTPSGLAQSVSIITGEELRAANPVDTKTAISTAAGIHIDQVGKAGGFSSVYVRGAEQSHLLVLIDGIRVNDATTTRGSAFDLSEIDLASIERIEVLRGPGSAVHGGEALAGVINVVTKRGAAGKPKVGAHVGVGEFGYRKAAANAGGGTESAQYSFTAGHEASGKRGDEEAFQRLNTVGASVRFSPSKTVGIDLTLRHARRKSEEFPDGSGGERFALNRLLEEKQARDTIAGLGVAIGDAQTARFEVRASLFDRTEESATPDVLPLDPAGFPVPARTDDTDFKRKSLQFTLSREFSDTLKLLVGAELQQEDGKLDEDATALGVGLTELQRDTRSLFAEASFAPSPRLSFQFGLRHDSFDGDGSVRGQIFNFGTFGFDPVDRRFDLAKESQTTPHVGAVWTLPNGATTLKASYSEGFKAPSFFALGNFLVGREDLKPERSRNFELGLQQKLGERGTFDVSVFRVKYRDLVDLVEDLTAPIGVRLTNRGEVVSTGIEPSVSLKLGDQLRLRGALTLMDLDVRDGREALPNRPEKKASLSAIYDLDARHSFSATMNYVGSSIDQPQVVPDGVRLGGYTTVDAVWKIKFERASVLVSVDNVLDREYQQFFGFETFGRRFRLDVRAEY